MGGLYHGSGHKSDPWTTLEETIQASKHVIVTKVMHMQMIRNVILKDHDQS